MVTSKIILLLRKFTIKEISGFREFLSSPYFNKKEKLLQFYDKLIKYHPEFEEEKINKEKIYKSMYRVSKFSPQVYKNLSSELYHLGTEFIAIEAFRQNETKEDIQKLKRLDYMHIDSLYEIELKAIEQKLRKADYYEDYFLDKFDLTGIKMNHYFFNSRQKEGMHLGIEEGSQLLNFFLVNLNRIVFGLCINRSIFNLQFGENVIEIFTKEIIETGALSKTIKLIEAGKEPGWQVVLINYYMLLSMLYQENDEYYNKAKDMVFSNINKLSREHKYEFSNALFTISTTKINASHTKESYERAYEISEFQLKNNIYKTFNESNITVYKFRNIFMIGFQLGKFSWIEKFVAKYIKEVTPVYRESLHNHCMAFIEFQKGNNETSLEYLNKVKLEQFIYKIDVKNLTLFNYYEMGYFENMRSLLVSFRQFLKSNKFVSETFRQNNFNILKRLEKLIAITEDFDVFEYEKLRSEIGSNQYAIYGEWFLKQLKKIKKGAK